MANSITGVNDDIIAQSALMAFIKKIQPLNAFSRNFSSDAARPGDKVSVLRETYPDVAAADKTTHADYTIQDCDSDAVEISLGQPKYVSWGLDDVEIASSSAVNMETYGSGKGNKLANAVLQTIWDDITNANFSAKVTVATASFDIDDVYDMKDALDDADAPEDGRSLVLSNAVATNLLKDNTITNNPNAGDQPLRAGSLGRLAGMDVFTTNVLPGNSENLTGFACTADAFAIAQRYLQPQEGHTYYRAEPLIDPAGSGITLGLRDWYDNDSGTRIRVLEWVGGNVVGIAGGLVRLVSA
jgi:hypothetical protein